MTDDAPAQRAYAQLAARIDAFHDRVEQRHPGGLTCHVGCSQCCHQHLTLMPLEWQRVARAVERLPPEERAALRLRVEARRDDPRCPLLDDTGRCRTYDARPVICRSHGLPIAIGGGRDVCPLNFTDGPEVAALDDDVVLDVDRLNVVLGVMSQVDGVALEPRVELFAGLSELLES